MRGAAEKSSSVVQSSLHGSIAPSTADVHQPFRPPQNVVMTGNVHHISSAVGQTRPQPVGQSTVSAAHWSNAGKPAGSRTVTGSNGTLASGGSRRLQLTDCVSLPAHVQKQLHHGQ